MKKRGIFKKAGCVLLGAAVILTGVTFLDSTKVFAGLSGSDFIYESAYESAPTEEEKASITTVYDINDVGATITPGAFSNCTSLASVNIGGMSSVMANAFMGCTNLRSVTLSNASYIDTSAFDGCTSLASLTVSGDNYYTYDGVLYSGTELIFVPAAKTEVTVKDGTTIIAAGAFNNSNVSKITFEDPWDITEIGDSEWYTNTLVIAEGGADSVVDTYFINQRAKGYTGQVHLDSSSTEVGTVVFLYNYQDANGNSVGAETISTDVDAGRTPTLSTASRTFTPDGGTEGTYDFVSVSPTTATAVVADQTDTYTFIYRLSSGTPTTGTVAFVYNYYDSTGTTLQGTETVTEAVTAGNTPTLDKSSRVYTPSGGTQGSYEFVSVSPTTATAAVAGQTDTYTFTYKLSTVTTASVSYVYNYYDSTGNTLQGTQTVTETVSAGETPTLNKSVRSYTPSGGTAGEYEFVEVSPSTATAAVAGQSYTYTFKYKLITGGNRIIHTVTVYDVFYKSDGTTKEKTVTRTVDKYDEGTSYKYIAKVYSGYECFGGENTEGTASTDRSVYFYYRPAGSGGTSGGGSSSTSGGTSGTSGTSGKSGSGTKTTVTYTVASDGSISSGHTQDATPTTADGFDNRYFLCMALFILGMGFLFLSRQKKLLAAEAGNIDEY